MTHSFKKIKTQYLSISEFNDMLNLCKIMGRKIAYKREDMILEWKEVLSPITGQMEKKPIYENFSFKWCLVEDLQTQIKLTVRLSFKHICTYITRKDTDNNNEVRPEDLAGGKGAQAYYTLSRYQKIPKTDPSTFYREGGNLISKYGSAKPLLRNNPKYDGHRHKAIGYDLNSAYSNAMINAEYPVEADPIRYFDYIREGDEMGFITDSKGGLKAVYEGWAIYIFHKTKGAPEGFKRFVNHWYMKKRYASNKIEKAHAKNTLNHCIGYMQRVNPFYRSTIITYANQLIENIIKKYPDDFIYSNTDSIVLRRPIEELPIGQDIGQFKVEHQGYFAFVGFNYQWNLETPSYRSKSKKWFKDGWDILKDEIPLEGNRYIFNKDRFELQQIKEFI